MIPSPMMLLVGLLALIAASVGGYWFGVDVEQGRVAERDLSVQIGREHSLLAQIEKTRVLGDKIGRQLAVERQGRERDALAFRDQLRGQHETLAECRSTGSLPAHAQDGGDRGGDTVALTPDGVRQWNRGLALGVAEADRSKWLDGADAGPGPVEIADALQNLADNAAILGACRARESGWQEWARSQGLTP